MAKKSLQSRDYTIRVLGYLPQEVEIGFIDPNTEMPKGQREKAFLSVGETAIPNFSIAWGKYTKSTGAIEFLTWGDPTGAAQKIRWIPNCGSLSVEYQTEKKLVQSDDDIEIPVKVGINRFDSVIDELKVELLKHHGYNKSNKSRNPKNAFVLFEEFDPVSELEISAGDLLKRREAEEIVLLGRDNAETLRILGKVFDKDINQEEKWLLQDLIVVSQSPEHFFKVLEDTALNFEQQLNAAIDCGLLEFSESELLITVEGKKEIFIDYVKGKDLLEKVSNIATTFYEEKHYYALVQLAEKVAVFKQDFQ